MLDRPSQATPERAMAAEATLVRLLGALASFGITRLAGQTSLDIVGIPTFAAIRPNGMMLSSHQGKGMTVPQAQVSALMEAIEVAAAERPPQVVCRADALAAGARVFPARRLRRHAGTVGDCVPGINLVGGEAVWVSRDIAHYAGDSNGVTQTTNGLGAGTCAQEAVFHAVCELVETDAETGFWLAGISRWRRFDPDRVNHPDVRHLCRQVAAAGLVLHTFDLTTDLGLPVVMAVLSDPDDFRAMGTVFGLGCHVFAALAVRAAILEAAQSRVTDIAGSRDDILAHEYSDARTVLPDWGGVAPGALPADGAPPDTPWHQWAEVAIRAAERVGADLVGVPLATGVDGICVWRVLSDTLEDRSVNPHWRPGARAFSQARP